MSKIILIVEDYEDARAYMKILVEGYGYEVFEAANGLEAIEIARDHPPNLILMDMSMPVMDGLTATKIIRTSVDNISEVPIVAVTAFGDSFEERAKAAGCNYLISKPVDLDTLAPIIEKYANR